MATTEKIMANNRESLTALINGEVQSTAVSGVYVSRYNVGDVKYSFASGYLHVYGDELKVDGRLVHLLQGGVTITTLFIGDE
jgi:hypothetical protein